jgi:hypothetical protein
VAGASVGCWECPSVGVFFALLAQARSRRRLRPTKGQQPASTTVAVVTDIDYEDGSPEAFQGRL